MKRSRPPRRSALALAGAIASLLAPTWLAPTAAAGGCAHFVTTRDHPASRPSMIGRWISDLVVQPGRSPAAPMPAPCAGAWCSGHSDAPMAGAGADGQGGDSWAWSPPLASPAPTDRSFRGGDTRYPRPVHGGPAVFHPPRHVSPA